jgi:hypothetical protein
MAGLEFDKFKEKQQTSTTHQSAQKLVKKQYQLTKKLAGVTSAPRHFSNGNISVSPNRSSNAKSLHDTYQQQNTASQVSSKNSASYLRPNQEAFLRKLIQAK